MSPMSQFCSRDDQQVLERQPTDEQHEDEAIVEESRNPSTATGEERTPTDASLMTAFREFFLSAFSDRYQEVGDGRSAIGSRLEERCPSDTTNLTVALIDILLRS